MKDLRHFSRRISHLSFHRSSHPFSRRSSLRSSHLSSHRSSHRSFHRSSHRSSHQHFLLDALVAWQVVKVQQLTQDVLHQLEAADVLVTINSIPAHQLGVQVVIVLQYCYTVLAQHVHNNLGEL
jgi:hypothetical protein